MSDSTIPTAAEHETMLERVAIARCLCRRPTQWPNAGAIQQERSKLAFEEAQKKTVLLPPAAAAAGYLRSLGLIVPPVDAPRRD